MSSSRGSGVDRNIYSIRRESGGSCDSNGCRIVPTMATDSDIEGGTERPTNTIVDTEQQRLVTVIEDLDPYEGSTIDDKLDTIINANAVVIIGWSHCPFCLDVRETLANEVGVPVHVIETDSFPYQRSRQIQTSVYKKTGSKQMPFCFINGQSIGGCDEVRTLHASGDLEKMLTPHLVAVQQPRCNNCPSSSMAMSNNNNKSLLEYNRRRSTMLLQQQQVSTVGTTTATKADPSSSSSSSSSSPVVMTMMEPRADRGQAVMPLFSFPPTVNHYAVRLTGVLSCLTAIVSVVLVFCFPNGQYGQWIGAYLVVDFGCRVVAGGSMSLLCQMASFVVATKPPDFRPGPPKQFAACCGFIFALVGTIFYFCNFQIIGAVFIAMLAMATGMEGFGNFCVGCVMFSKCIRYGLVPEYIYRVHTTSRPELVATYKNDSTTTTRKQQKKPATPPVQVVTDPTSKIGLKYKIKTDEWIRNDFDMIRNMQAQYFAMPMSLAALATAFKLGSNWGRNDLVVAATAEQEELLLSIPIWWTGTFGILGATCFVVFFVLYVIRMVRFPRKCVNEFDCPLRCGYFGYITTSTVLFSYLLYDWNGPLGQGASEWTARCLLWSGGLAHIMLVVTKIGEFIGMLHDVEHVHTTWLTLPIGSMVAAFVTPLIPMLANSDPENDVANVLLAQFFYAFSFLLYVTFFVVTFLKVVTTPNSNNAHRHSIFLWLAAPCTVGLANYSICVTYNTSNNDNNDDVVQCSVDFSQYYFIGLMMVLCLTWAALPYISFFGRDPFSMAYWSECFSLGMLAACAALFYGTNGFTTARVLMLISLSVAAVANGLALLHTLTSIRRRKLFTPTPKWGPLAYMKLTHEAIRAAIPKLRASLEQVNLLDGSNRGLNKFATLFSEFKLVHEEHSRQENLVIFKTFSEYFPTCRYDTYVQDHADDEAKLSRWSTMIDTLLDPKATASEKDTAHEHLVYNIPEFLDEQLVHMKGEEDNLQPIGRKYVPWTLQKEMVKTCYETTMSGNWEVMLPFVINNCSRHMQRVRYIKCLCWAMPERAQQIGAIVYRHVDAVMWERLRVELPEIIPRGERNWRRYY